MKKNCLAGVIQLNSSEDRDENLEKVSRYLQEAAEAGCELVALPEVFDCFCEDQKKYGLAQLPDGGSTLRTLSELAAKFTMWVIGGSMILRSSQKDRIWNRSHVIDPNGQVVAVYNKIHLFDVNLSTKSAYQESIHTVPGKDPVLCETPFGKLGLSICYDLRFPELYRSYSSQGASILSVPSAFTQKTGRDHWEPLLRARAIENQCFVLAPNQYGIHTRGLETWGHSMIVDPWGVILAQKGEGEGLAMAQLDLDSLAEIQRRIP